VTEDAVPSQQFLCLLVEEDAPLACLRFDLRLAQLSAGLDDEPLDAKDRSHP